MPRYRPSALLAAAVLGVAVAPHVASAADVGNITGPFSPKVTLPATADRHDAAVATAKAHVAAILARDPAATPALSGWLSDYQAVLRRFPDLAEARPVRTEDGLVSRYLVGFDLGDGAVGGFIPVTADGAKVCGELMWGKDLAPLWRVPAAEWAAAAAVNDIELLAELVTPYDGFTHGIPVEPADRPSWTFVEGSLDDLPYKTQEERKTWLGYVNKNLSPIRPLKATLGRRTGTSKCLSVAASYVADFFAAEVGRELGSYVNGVGGHKEYGANPRALEAIFHKRHKDGEGGLLSMDFRMAPFGKDRVTGEKIPYSVRSFARILTETDRIELADPVVPSQRYALGDNPFAMDDAPIYLFKRADYDPESLARAIDTWGPLLAQHTTRSRKGKPKRFIGVHAVTIVGYGEIADGTKVFAYKESFGNFTKDYLEDSFVGPRVRAVPLAHYYQAIAFPHRLALTAEAEAGAGGRAEVAVTVTTNRGHDKVDPHLWRVEVDGEAVDATPTRSARGEYRFEVPLPAGADRATLRISASRRYFADRHGNAVFSVAVPLEAGKATRSAAAGEAVAAPDPAEAAKAWAEDIAGEMVTLVSVGREAMAARVLKETVAQVPGMRRALTAALVELHGGDGRKVPASLRAALTAGR